MIYILVAGSEAKQVDAILWSDEHIQSSVPAIHYVGDDIVEDNLLVGAVGHR